MATKQIGKLNATLGIGPMSSEAIEATFRYSHYNRRQLMLIASKNQIDHKGGYVNNWNTKQYMTYIKQLKTTYSNSDVKVCRDHCGPGFNGIYNLDDTYATIKSDIENGFDLMHIDFCHFKGTNKAKIEETKKAIEYTLKLNPNILIEVGTDENLGANYSAPNLSEIKKEIDYIQSFCKPEFYVVQTGTLIKEINQVGKYNRNFADKISEMLVGNGVKLKEHNADYLTKEDLALRKHRIGALNIAPQLGVMQTTLVLNKCLTYGVDFQAFMDDAYKSKKWKKWLYKNKPTNQMLCSLIAGHYVFNSDNYQSIIAKLSECEDINEIIINSFMDLIGHYEQR